ncbi:MAG TPA: LysM peptidoglycan-binding domain-containing protein [Gordonia polyisoprenivorans]|uniref:LysM peptidoglycan-binding domain-containing protein n=1 Tax=Gordonia polyisoprenivorans TaxID=84595 RepID=UPI000B99D999|nr:LysM peptidoglycan-binding domain-containing protein [Gordonia polyisoprenivorans]OZC30288.1 peptidoglycan-binding protein [Gordonia polyisoprenivorans]QUD85323.1 LysM peptidoglycan-binding domain-containing protein [Gordonia polyisoprenivorans]HCS59425.1 LysM peptidoglycan-binding domain-containing protein [Gordonia polyisoprenivorans]
MPTVLLPTAPGTNDLPVRSRRTAHRAAAVRRGASMPARATVEHRAPEHRSSDRRLPERRTLERDPARRRPAYAGPARTGARRLPAVAGTRCATPVGPRVTAHRTARRTGAMVAVLTGVALALLVWLVAVAGSDYQQSTTPAPAATEVVHVRAGESLNSVAARVAPDLPRQAVIDEIARMNEMSGSGLQVGQALLVPAYR